MDFIGIGLLPIVIVVAIIFILIKAVVTVPQGYEFTLEKFGRYKRTMEPGLHFIMPFFENIGRKINMMEQVLDVPRQEVISKDNAMLGVDAVVFYQVLDAAKAAYEVDNLRHSIIPLRFATWLGVLSGFIAIGVGAWALYVKVVEQRAVQGWATLMILIALGSSAQLLVMGILGEYVGRIYEEVKRRPLYVVDGEINLSGADRNDRAAP